MLIEHNNNVSKYSIPQIFKIISKYFCNYYIWLIIKKSGNKKYTDAWRYLVSNVWLYPMIFGFFLRWSNLTMKRFLNRIPHRSFRSVLHNINNYRHNSLQERIGNATKQITICTREIRVSTSKFVQMWTQIRMPI